jgi:hypothetical protein
LLNNQGKIIMRSSLNVIMPRALLVAAVMACCGQQHAAAQEKILFLHLRMHNDSISLTRSTLQPGVVKQAREAQPSSALAYELRSTAGELLGSGSLRDPSIRRLEYEDPLHPGRLIVRIDTLADVEFTLRLPFRKNIQLITFYRNRFDETPAQLQKVAGTLIGTVDLQFDEGVK